MTNDAQEFCEQNALAAIQLEIPKQVLNGHLQDFDRRSGGKNEQVAKGCDLNKTKPFDLPVRMSLVPPK